jgi:general secretion pathway protein A
MYQAHFGLNKQLFDTGIAQDAAVFRSPKHEPLFAHLKLAFGSPDAVVTLTGGAGVGKTTLASAAVRASTTRLALAWINGTPTNAAELLELLLTELGCNAHRTTRIERMQMWRQFLSEMSATDSRVFIVVERTEDLAHEVLRALDALTAADQSGSAGANVLLLGQSSLDRHLAAQPLDSLRQRIRLRLRVAPFDAKDAEDYLRLHVTRAGGDLERLFAPGALATVHRYSGGVARVINNLCETALTLAASEGKTQLTAELIASTAVDWLGLEDAAAPTPVAAAPVSAPAPAIATGTVAAPASAVAAAPPPPAPTGATASAPPAAAPQPTPPVVIATLTVAPATTAPIVVEPIVLLAAEPAAPVAEPIAASAPHAPAAIAAAPTAPQQMPVSIAADEPTLTEADFGAATDVPVVAAPDFPVLTDEVEYEDFMAEAAPSTPPRKELLINLPPAPIVRQSAPTARISAPSAAQQSVPVPVVNAARIETAYTAKRPNAPLASTPTPTPKPAAPTPPAAAAKVAAPTQPTAPRQPSHDDDPLRQTQTMRAISVAKSIDDISSSMAETLFGDADLEMLSQALASAGWSEDKAAAAEQPPTQSTPAARPKAKPAPPPASPEDDLLDLLGLGADAPLELLDDSAPHADEAARKTATRR